MFQSIRDFKPRYVLTINILNIQETLLLTISIILSSNKIQLLQK